MNAYTLFSGSSGNCIYLQENSTRILVDCGCNTLRIQRALAHLDTSLSGIDAIFITHEHSDHTGALPVIAKNFAIPVYCQNEVAKELYLSLLNKGVKGEAAALAKCIRTVLPGEEYELGDFVIAPFSTPHDSVDSQGFVIGEGELGIATDLGHVSEEVRRYLSGCQNVILESNHDLEMLATGPYPPYLKQRVASDRGHLNNRDCASFCTELLDKGCRSFTLFHLSKENNTPELALEQSRLALSERGAEEGKDYLLQVADRCEVTKVL